MSLVLNHSDTWEQKSTCIPKPNGYQARSSTNPNVIHSQLKAPPIDGGTEGCGISSGQQTVGEGGHLAQGRVRRPGTAAGHFELSYRCLADCSLMFRYLFWSITSKEAEAGGVLTATQSIAAANRCDAGTRLKMLAAWCSSVFPGSFLPHMHIRGTAKQVRGQRCSNRSVISCIFQSCDRLRIVVKQ